MGPFAYILIVVAAAGVLVAAIFMISRRDEASIDTQGNRELRAKDRSTVLREAGRRLKQNPRDPVALEALADLYFREQDYENALKSYKTLTEMCATVPELDEFQVTLRHGLSALKLKDTETAYQSLTMARSFNESSFEVNYHLGCLELLRKNYQRAVTYLQKAQLLEPESLDTQRFLGQALYRTGHFREALPCLNHSLEYEPDDKESLFCLGQIYYSLNQRESALKIFTHLRADPLFGARAALASGTIHLNTRAYQKAVVDLQIGLRHPGLPAELLLELKYRLAAAYLALDEIGQALRQWREIRDAQPDYKDVEEKLQQYQEISANASLKTFLLAPTSEFVNLCRRLATHYYPHSPVKLRDIHLPKSEYVDILADVKTANWEDQVLFRFVRSSGQVGELLLREQYARQRELRAGHGVCITAGEFTDTARAFIEARPIDLVDKPGLIRLFRRITGLLSSAPD